MDELARQHDELLKKENSFEEGFNRLANEEVKPKEFKTRFSPSYYKLWTETSQRRSVKPTHTT